MEAGADGVMFTSYIGTENGDFIQALTTLLDVGSTIQWPLEKLSARNPDQPQSLQTHSQNTN
tara:strand:- start:389 stop:574 length:186 start_codon:yes stop_codon:yes gene_type:complete